MSRSSIKLPLTMQPSCPGVTTVEESWIYGYDPETKQQSKSPSSLRPRKVRQVKSKFKSMFIIFFDVKLIIYK
jgi:hypothetical protein